MGRKRLVLPDTVVYALLSNEEADTGGLRRGTLSVLVDYMIPPRGKSIDRGYVDLKPMTIMGFMSMGKTVFAAHVTRLVRRRLKARYGVELLSVTGKSIVDVVEYLRDNVDLISGRKALLLFLDDIFYQGLSRESGKAKQMAEKYYSDIRHKFEDLGFNNGVLYVLFAAQRLKLIPPFFRSSPILVFKPLIPNDKYERETIIEALDYDSSRFSRLLAEAALALLEATARIIYTKWDDRAKAITIIKPGWDYPFIYIQEEAPDPKKVFDIVVPFNYSGVYGEDEEEVMRRVDETAKRLLLKLAIKSIAVGMELRDKGIHSLSKKLYTDVLRNVLGLPFNQNEVTWEFIEEAINEIDTKELKKLIELRTSKPIETLLLVKHN